MHSLKTILQSDRRQQTAQNIVLTGNTVSCTACGDAGWVRKDVPYRHPDFGKLFPCTVCKSVEKRRFKKLDAMSLVPEMLRGKTWTTFPVQMDKEAIRLMKAYVTYVKGGLTKESRGVLLMGKNQVGKTGLAYCAYSEIAYSVFLPASTLFERLRISKLSGDENAYYRLMEDLFAVPHLVIDDLGAEKITDSRLESLFTLLQHRVEGNVATAVTTNLSVDGLRDHFGDRIYSRFVGERFTKIIVRGELGHLIQKKGA